ncbi:protein LHCP TRANSLOCATION DEFECT [Heracleum sosnowskyi]|uniref:Protein LHCP TRANSLOCATION DEFECT n=1 Tax=Heracleum sosnowskyi TaxID=360622 RepID=A0AAD8MZS5_9APIA|nr:protein LHCP TRANSLOCATION DEFECT [Heracleum sosnowskyi]
MVMASCSVATGGGSVVLQLNQHTHAKHLPSQSCSRRSISLVIKSKFVGTVDKRLGWLTLSKIGLLISSAATSASASGTTCWFKFGKNGVDAEQAGIYGSQSRNDFDRDDVEQYFNYMGMLAVEGTYDKMEALLNQKIHPVDILLILAAAEGDKPKIEELLRAGADYTVKDVDGRTAIDRASSDEIKDFILGFSVPKA